MSKEKKSWMHWYLTEGNPTALIARKTAEAAQFTKDHPREALNRVGEAFAHVAAEELYGPDVALAMAAEQDMEHARQIAARRTNASRLKTRSA